MTMLQVWHLVLPWTFCISAWSKGASSMSTSSSCAPSLSTAISSTGLSLLCREATGSTGMSYAGFLALITRFWGDGGGARARLVLLFGFRELAAAAVTSGLCRFLGSALRDENLELENEKSRGAPPSQ